VTKKQRSLPKPVTVSVLMAVFNTPIQLVKRAIESVLAQDFQNFELIILDDGSELALSENLLLYCQQHQEKVTYLWHQNRGQSASINRGILLSSGKYIAIIDSDDEYKPNHLSVCLEAMSAADLIASCTDTIVDNPSDYYVPDRHDFQKSAHVDDCILFATLFGRKEVFEAISFKEIYAADSDFYEQATAQFLTKKLNSRTYIYYRNNPQSITALLKKEQLSFA